MMEGMRNSFFFLFGIDVLCLLSAFSFQMLFQLADVSNIAVSLFNSLHAG